VYKSKETNTPFSPKNGADGQAGRGRHEIRLSARRRRLHAQCDWARVRLASGNISVTDGPFSESKEVIGGLAIIEASSKAEAIEYVRNFLHVAGDGECELRQLYDANSVPGAEKAAGA